MRNIKVSALSLTLMSAVGAVGGCVGEPNQETDGLGEATAELASDCENGANGFIDISDSLSGTVQRTLSLGAGVTATLESGIVAGTQRGWARIHGDTIEGDQVRMDWTIDNHQTVKVFCGPFTVGGTNQTKTTAAKTTSSLSTYQFRVCGRLAGGTLMCNNNWW